MNYPFLKPRYYFSLWKDIVAFVRNPRSEADLQKSTKFKVYDTIALFLLKLLVLIPVGILIGLLHDPENLTQVSLAERFSPLVLLLVAGIILPTVEETCFRLSLKFKPLYLSLSIGVLVYYLLSKAIYQTKISVVDDSFEIRAGLSLAFMLLLFPLLSIPSVKEKLSLIWETYFRSIYYTSCLIFAGIHIFNYELSWINLAMLPLLTLPQLMSAIIYGYTRVAFGFQYPLLFHMATNMIAVGLSFLPFTD